MNPKKHANPYKLIIEEPVLSQIPRNMKGDNQKDMIVNLFINQLLRPKTLMQLTEDAYFMFKPE
jgi:hypothetical protein